MIAVSDRQLEIIQAAGTILTASGVSGLTIKNLAKEMKFSESAIYRHFTSKEVIIIAMLNYLAETIDERLGKATQAAGTPVEKFKALFQSQLLFFEQHPQFAVAVFSDGLMEESKSINEAILRIMRVKMKHLLPIMTEGQQQGEFTDAITTEELIHIVMGAFRLQMYKWRLANFKFDIVEKGESLMQALLKIIQSK